VSDVDTVVLTHLHEDHYGGSVTPGGVPVFPSARYVVQRTEVDSLPDGDLALTYAVEPLRRTGQLQVVDGRTRLHDGRVHVVPTPGHTAGHQSVTVEGAHRPVVITGDVLVHAVQLANPDVEYHFEADGPLAARTRHELLDGARRDRALLATAHLTRPFVDAGQGQLPGGGSPVPPDGTSWNA
jgi:glyoxylase-like metal-dependent hydrolase (beta-lactamase superfamily II)